MVSKKTKHKCSATWTVSKIWKTGTGQEYKETTFKLLLDKCFENNSLLGPKTIVLDYEMAIHNIVKNI